MGKGTQGSPSLIPSNFSEIITCISVWYNFHLNFIGFAFFIIQGISDQPEKHTKHNLRRFCAFELFQFPLIFDNISEIPRFPS